MCVDHVSRYFHIGVFLSIFVCSVCVWWLVFSLRLLLGVREVSFPVVGKR